MVTTYTMEAKILKFSKWLKASMDSAGLSQTQLAEKSGVSKQHINGLLAAASGRESKARQPSVETVDSLANALKKPIAEARLAAGWATEISRAIDGETSLILIFRALRPDRRGDLLAFAETLYRRTIQPGDELEPIGEGSPNKNN